MIVRLIPFEDEITTGKMRKDLPIRAICERACDTHRARTRSARERDSTAALPSSHRHFISRMNLHPMCIDATRKCAVGFNGRSDALQVERLHIVYEEDRVW